MSEKEIRALTKRLLPGAEQYASEPPPDWKRWTRPEKQEPIDDVIVTMISRRRAPKIKKAALGNVTCPFWYARAGVVMAVETANRTENEAKENRRLARQGTSELLRSRTRTQNPAILRAAAKRMGNSAKALSTLIESSGSITENLKMVALLEPSLCAALKTNSASLHACAQWRNDELFEAYIRSWNKFVDHARPLAEALVDIQKFARTGLLGVSNNPPAYLQRTFVEKMAQSFASLTGAAATSGTVFRDFVTAAWTSAFPDSTEPALERVIRNLRAFDRP